jgi:hypothetical protein
LSTTVKDEVVVRYFASKDLEATRNWKMVKGC